MKANSSYDTYEKTFQAQKKIVLQHLEQAKREKQVDPEIIPILNCINKQEEYYSTSSCAGRIVILELPEIGDKKHAVFLGKWHKKITPDDVFNAVVTASKGQLWMLAQSPIFHIVAKTLKAADTLLKHGYSSGFKHSSLKTTEGKIVVELMSTERLDAPIGQHGNLLCSPAHVELLVEISNHIIERSQGKLHRLQQELENL